MGGTRSFSLGAMLLLLALLMVACGDSGGDPESAQGKEVTVDWSLYPPGPTREFVIPYGDNVVQEFGREATQAEREQASRTIAAWMRARAAQDWKRDCSYFSRGYIHSLITTDAVRVSGGKVKNCPQGLAYFGHEASGSYKNNLTGPIDSLRVHRGLAFAQYHGNDGHDWIIPMDREDGRWWVASAKPIGRSS